MTAVVEQLRERARTYELNAEAARERGDAPLASAQATVALTLLELAEVFEDPTEEDGR